MPYTQDVIFAHNNMRIAIPIWKSFVEYVLELFDNQWDNKDRVNRTRANLKKAVNATRWHISQVSCGFINAINAETNILLQSQEIWNSYIQFQVEWLEVISGTRMCLLSSQLIYISI